MFSSRGGIRSPIAIHSFWEKKAKYVRKAPKMCERCLTKQTRSAQAKYCLDCSFEVVYENQKKYRKPSKDEEIEIFVGRRGL